MIIGGLAGYAALAGSWELNMALSGVILTGPGLMLAGALFALAGDFLQRR